MLLMIENRVRGGICQESHRYAEGNNKYMNNYDKKTESSYVAYMDGRCLKNYQ